MFKFLHTADIHLDSPLLNLNKYDDSPREEFRSATRRAFDNIVELAIAEEVRFVLVAGDLYDGDCSDFNTPLHFRRRMLELQSHDIRVFLIHGNHDAASSMKKAFRLQLPDNVQFFRTDKPETKILEDIQVAIHGQGFAQKVVEDDLSKNFPDPVHGYINIGMLHTNCGARDGHDRYAPSTVNGLQSRGYDYWALGHIHKYWGEIGPRPWIIYPGNPQGRHIGETGKRGVVIATVDGDRIDRKRHYVDVARWYHVVVDAEDCDDADGVVTHVLKCIESDTAESAAMPLAVRLDIQGTTPAHGDLCRQREVRDREIREEVLNRFDERIWVEKIKFRTRAPLTAESSQVDSAMQEFARSLDAPDLVEFARDELRAEFEKMLTSLPHDVRLPASDLDLENQQAMDVLVKDAQQLLVARVLSSGGTGR